MSLPRPPRIKFCGITRLDDAQRAVVARVLKEL
jgi:phosphoribosylanthranilate isomerase